VTAPSVPAPLATITAGPPAVPAAWVLTADARHLDAGRRDALARNLRGRSKDGRLLLETCHRVELYGIGDPGADVLAHAAGDAHLRSGSTAIRHLLRVAAGLESAVVGEDQILAQLRRAGDELRADLADPVLVRLVQVALGLGRRVRRDRGPRERGLASRALAWLGPRVGPWAEARLLVAGAGDMGTAVALGATHRGATVVVATRTPRRLPTGIPAVSLREGARMAASMDGIVVALGGEWDDLRGVTGPLPPIVDLSSPPAVRLSSRERGPLMDIDGLYGRSGAPRPADAEFVRRAEGEVDAAEAAFLQWTAARPSAVAARRLDDLGRRRAERRAAAALRRLPNLTDRERAIVMQLAGQVAADLLHEPLSRLGTDATGSAREAARTLFDL
jgi:glutamyl-tRNA reductase